MVPYIFITPTTEKDAVFQSHASYLPTALYDLIFHDKQLLIKPANQLFVINYQFFLNLKKNIFYSLKASYMFIVWLYPPNTSFPTLWSFFSHHWVQLVLSICVWLEVYCGVNMGNLPDADHTPIKNVVLCHPASTNG